MERERALCLAIFSEDWDYFAERPTLIDAIERRVAQAFAQNTLTATTQLLDSGQWYAELPGAPGVWATGKTQEIALDTLCEVYREWLRLQGDMSLVPPT